MSRTLELSLAAVILAAGCMAPLTQQGAAIRLVTAPQKDRECEYLAVVTASESMGMSTGGDAESALNKARNKVAAAGGNAMLVVSTNTNAYATTVVAEALRCKVAPAPAKPDTSVRILR